MSTKFIGTDVSADEVEGYLDGDRKENTTDELKAILTPLKQSHKRRKKWPNRTWDYLLESMVTEEGLDGRGPRKMPREGPANEGFDRLEEWQLHDEDKSLSCTGSVLSASTSPAQA